MEQMGEGVERPVWWPSSISLGQSGRPPPACRPLPIASAKKCPSHGELGKTVAHIRMILHGKAGGDPRVRTAVRNHWISHFAELSANQGRFRGDLHLHRPGAHIPNACCGRGHSVIEPLGTRILRPETPDDRPGRKAQLTNYWRDPSRDQVPLGRDLDRNNRFDE